MKIKKKLIIAVVLIIIIVSIFIGIRVLKTYSLEEDILSDVNFSEIKASTLITENDEIEFVDEKNSKELLKSLKKIQVTRPLINPALNNFNSISFSGPGGAFKIFVYENQYISIPSKSVTEIYKIDNKKNYNELRKIIEDK